MTNKPLTASGFFLGAGLGGFLDGIVFHQILQYHQMISSVLPPDNLVNAKINMYWDGIFHLGVWLLTVIGIILLFATGKRGKSEWSGKILFGGALLGFGFFNFAEGIVNHFILGLHHVYEYTENTQIYDFYFVLSGVFLFSIGLLLVRSRERYIE